MQIIYFQFPISLTVEESSYRMKNAQLRLDLSTLLSLGKKPNKSQKEIKTNPQNKTFKHSKKRNNLQPHRSACRCIAPAVGSALPLVLPPLHPQQSSAFLE